MYEVKEGEILGTGKKIEERMESCKGGGRKGKQERKGRCQRKRRQRNEDRKGATRTQGVNMLN